MHTDKDINKNFSKNEIVILLSIANQVIEAITIYLCF